MSAEVLGNASSTVFSSSLNELLFEAVNELVFERDGPSPVNELAFEVISELGTTAAPPHNVQRISGATYRTVSVGQKFGSKGHTDAQSYILCTRRVGF